MSFSKAVACSLLLSGLVWAADPYCPAYPAPQRELDRARLALDRAFQTYAKRANKAPLRSAEERRNLIDNFVFSKMEADGVAPAAWSTDEEFLRRVYLDLTGRIPTIAQVQSFLSNDNPNKRDLLIEELLGSDAYADRWTSFYANLFEITSRYYNYISPQGRNRFFAYLHDFVQRDRSYADVAREMISAEGDAHLAGPPNFVVRAFQQGDPIQDTWDTLTDRTTVRFLGMKSECVSCHDGRRHLEEINYFLTSRRRTDFWKMSAFYSRTDIQQFPIDSFYRQVRNIIADRGNGGYYSVVNPNNPGPRPARYGGPYTPNFFLDGTAPQSGEWRKELARILTSNRQFARAAVNYLWAALFVQGIVDPPDGWDYGRIDPKNPPPAPWTLQPSNPDLLEALADEFIRNNYSIKTILRLMAKSHAYQLSSNYTGNFRPEFDRYFARHLTRRLSAEEAYDAIARATMTETPMVVEGYDAPVMFAQQLPDPSEPRNDGNIRNFLTNFGRGDWWQNPRTSTSTVLQVLFMMNDNTVNFRTFATRDGNRNTRVAQLLESNTSDEDAIRTLFLATLSHPPDDREMQVAMNNRRGPREQWLSDLQWALLNKLDFLFNH